MVSEKGADDLRPRVAGRRVRLGGRPAARPVVDRFIEAEPPVEAFPGQPREILRRGRGIDETRQRSGVRCDNQVVAQAALQSEPGHTERTVLVVPRPIGEGVGRLRNSPGHAAPARVLDLAPDADAAALVQQGAREAAHQQQRHQVLEHRPAPRHQGRAAVDVRHQAPEVKPVMLWDVALGDRDKARQARFRREQVVECRVEPAGTVRVGEAVPDRENAPAVIVEKVEPHGVGEHRGSPRERVQRVVGNRSLRTNGRHGVHERARPEEKVLCRGIWRPQALDLGRRVLQLVREYFQPRGIRLWGGPSGPSERGPKRPALLVDGALRATARISRAS